MKREILTKVYLVVCLVHWERKAVIISLRLGTFSLVVRVMGAAGAASRSGTFRVTPELPCASCGSSATSAALSDGLTGTISRTLPSSPVAVSVPLCDRGIINGNPSSELNASGVESFDVVAWLLLHREFSEWPKLIACAMAPNSSVEYILSL